MYVNRIIEEAIASHIQKSKPPFDPILLYGPRQVGKSTLLEQSTVIEVQQINPQSPVREIMEPIDFADLLHQHILGQSFDQVHSLSSPKKYGSSEREKEILSRE